MKYHHLERCFTNRVKRPVVSRHLRVLSLLGLGLYGGNPAFMRWSCISRQTDVYDRVGKGLLLPAS
jgi:hypothetical protein